jgi:hypothetical protein
MKILLVGTELFHADKQRDKHDTDYSLFRNYANAAKSEKNMCETNTTLRFLQAMAPSIKFQSINVCGLALSYYKQYFFKF